MLCYLSNAGTRVAAVQAAAAAAVRVGHGAREASAVESSPWLPG